jgi:hypothetical protein
MADAYAVVYNPDTNRALETISARYQGLADLQKANALHALKIISSRYQGMAELYQGSE